MPGADLGLPVLEEASRSGRSYAVRDTEVVSGTHIIADLTLDLGKVVHDYLPEVGQRATEIRMPLKDKVAVATGGRWHRQGDFAFKSGVRW